MQIRFFDPVPITEDANVLFGAVVSSLMVLGVVTIDWLAILDSTATQDPMAAATKHRQRIEAAFSGELERMLRAGQTLPEHIVWTSGEFSKPDRMPGRASGETSHTSFRSATSACCHRLHKNPCHHCGPVALRNRYPADV